MVDRPIYVFDEWASDQDPTYRRFFYVELLPELRARGKTVVCVTHDDEHFGRADRILHFEEGRIVSGSADEGTPSPPTDIGTAAAS